MDPPPYRLSGPLSRPPSGPPSGTPPRGPPPGPPRPPPAPGGPRGGPRGGPPGGPPRARPRARGPPGRAPPGGGVWDRSRGVWIGVHSGVVLGPPNGPPKTPFLGPIGVQIQSKMGGPGGPQKGVFLGGVSAMLSECTTGCLSKTVPNVHFCPKFRVPCLSRMGDLLNTPRNVQNSVPNLSRGGPGEGGVPGGVPHMVGGVPPGPPNGALVNGPYGPSSGSPSQYSPGGVPPWTPPR